MMALRQLMHSKVVERKCVILDLVVREYKGRRTMGNFSNERKVNVACTRAKDFFFVVRRLDMLAPDEIKEGERQEYTIELLQRLKNRGAFKTFQ